MNAARTSTDAAPRASRVRLMVFDVDGVLTDGRLWYSAEGEAVKAFHVLDGHGLKQLMQAGLSVALLSGRRSPAVSRRAEELGITEVLQGIGDKGSALDALLVRLGIRAEEAGAMGDDEPDLPMLRRCGFAAAPPGAHASILASAHLVTLAAGGRGAAREVCDFVLRARASRVDSGEQPRAR